MNNRLGRLWLTLVSRVLLLIVVVRVIVLMFTSRLTSGHARLLILLAYAAELVITWYERDTARMMLKEGGWQVSTVREEWFNSIEMPSDDELTAILAKAELTEEDLRKVGRWRRGDIGNGNDRRDFVDWCLRHKERVFQILADVDCRHVCSQDCGGIKCLVPGCDRWTHGGHGACEGHLPGGELYNRRYERGDK